MEKMFFAHSCNIYMDKFRKEPKTQIKDEENLALRILSVNKYSKEIAQLIIIEIINVVGRKKFVNLLRKREISL